MRSHPKFSRTLSAATVTAFALAILTVTQAGQRNGSQTTHISNFGCINESFYRGAQPSGRDYDNLAAMGVKTVLDLQEDGERNEQQMVTAAGMKFFRIGLSDSSWPSRENADKFLKIVNDPANQPVFIHCHGGRHRAGIMTAIYRMTHDGWTAEQAYAEMKRYGFESGFGHGSLKDYVYDYYAGLDQKRVVVNVSK